MHLHLRACAGLRGHLVDQSERSLMLQVRVGVPSRHVVSVSGCVSPVDSFMCGRPLAICLCVFSPAILAQCTPLVPDYSDSGGSVAVCSSLSCDSPLFFCCRIVFRAGDFRMPSTRAITYPLPSTCFSICRRSSLFCTLVHLTHKSIQAMRLPAAYSSPPDLSTSSSASAVLRFGIDRHGDCLMC